ncbi:PH domain-containing protein [Myroides fluvii]|uniref:PH domain-containing protein n=1 Tax=Myroides fluvii TaxID=2572594 RepID=UPI00131CCFA0|nr:PH domain-containing protein [Myroides fluvii]
MKKFPAKKKGFLVYPIIASIIPVVVFFTHEGSLKHLWFDFALSSLPFLLLIWIYFSTTYWIQDNHLHYRSAFIRGKISIIRINEIQLNKSLWVGLKPALATKGMIITYNTHDEIYIAPIDNKELANELIEINPDIKTVNHP